MSQKSRNWLWETVNLGCGNYAVDILVNIKVDITRRRQSHRALLWCESVLAVECCFGPFFPSFKGRKPEEISTSLVNYLSERQTCNGNLGRASTWRSDILPLRMGWFSDDPLPSCWDEHKLPLLVIFKPIILVCFPKHLEHRPLVKDLALLYTRPLH